MDTNRRPAVLTTTSVLALASFLAATTAWAAPKTLKPTGTVSAGDNALQDAFAFDDGGKKLATIQFTPRGQVLLSVATPGGKPQVTELSSFTSTPEKVLGVGGYWFVISNEGQRRAAIIDSSGHLRRTTQRFDDCELSSSPKAFVAVSERQEPGGNRRFSVQAYKPDGSTLMLQDVVVEGNGNLVGTEGESFLGFSNSHFSVMVEKPGAFNRKTDSRLPPQFAIRDVKTGKTGPGKTHPNLENFLDYVHKRGEKPDLPAVMVLAEGQKGFELVGPGEKVRPVDLTVPVRDYDPTTLDQRQLGGKVIFSLLADRPGHKGDMKESGRYALAFFSLDPGSGKVSVIGEVPLPDRNVPTWSAGGNKIAVARKTADGNREIAIYSR
jgi:hypothetical protein